MNDASIDAGRFYCAQLDALFRRTRTSSMLALPATFLVALLHAGHVPNGQLFMWAAAMVVVYAVRVTLAHTYLSRPGGGEASPLWLDIETMITAAAGGGWGAMLFMLDTGQHDLLFTVKLAFLAAACAFTMNSMTVIRSVYLAFLLPIFTITIVFALMETPFLAPAGRYGLIAAALTYLALLLTMSVSVGRLMNDSLRRQLSHADTLRQLASTLEREQAAHAALEQQTRQLEATHLRQHVFATHDPLTRLFNRHRISEVLVRELHLRRRFQIPVSALIVEIDNFMQFVEQHGQGCGDELLVAFATFLAADLRDIDYVGRCSGEKFCCVLSRTDGHEAEECAERIRQKITGCRFIDGKPEIAVTASFGVSPAIDGDDAESLLARADAALYEARRQGRNSIRRIDGEDAHLSRAG